jgi:hypothetical protein
MHLDVRFEWEELWRLTPGVGMSFTHEPVADHTDAKSPRHKSWWLN